MDDETRKSAEPADNKNSIERVDAASEKQTRKKGTVSPAKSDGSRKSGRRRSRESKSRSLSRERGGRRRRSRSRSRGYSPDRRRRYNRGSYRSDFYNRRKRSPSDRRSPVRGRNAGRRSRSKSFDRFKNRRNRSGSRDRNDSRGNRGWKKGPRSPSPVAPPPPTNNFNMAQSQMYPDSNTFSGSYPPSNMAGYMPNQQYPNYDYPVPIMQPPPPSFTSYPPPNMQPVPPGDDFQSNAWNMQQVPPPPIINMQQEPSNLPQPPPPPLTAPPKPETSDEDKKRYEAAVEQEMKNQRETLCKQRDDYKRRAAGLRRELKILKEQREDLVSGSEPPSPTTNGFLKENDRLQAEIEHKIKTIDNVIDMLTGIIRDKQSRSAVSTVSPVKHEPSEVEASTPKKGKKRDSPKSDDSSPERLKTKVMESMKKKKGKDMQTKDEDEEKYQPKAHERFNYIYYDPEMHYCRSCSVFPKTAKDYLLHLHSKEHKESDKSDEIPWHENLETDNLPNYPNAPTKRIPIRGIQFFVPSSSWYCKICSVWMGDLHCASVHLKSKKHAAAYTDFMNKNPNFETNWLSERQTALDNHARNESIEPPPPPPLLAPQVAIPAPVPAPSTTIRYLGEIPLQINQKPKEPAFVATEQSTKKGKKKKKEKKKKKKSKKKRQSSSSSSSSSSDDSSDQQEKIPEKPVIDTSTSIRVAMRNSLKTTNAPSNHQPTADDNDNVGGKWTVVQQGAPAVPLVPLPPTISANGEAEKRKDELIISQWNVPEPIISEKEKQLLEQLKGRLKSREEARVEKKKEEVRPNKVDEDQKKVQNRSSSKGRDRKRSRSRNRSNRRSRSHSPARRNRRSRSYSPAAHRNRRSPRRRRSRSRSRGRRIIERPIVRQPEFKPRVPDIDSKATDRKKLLKKDENSKSSGPKKPTTATSGKKLPFIGRMPVFKKQVIEEEPKKFEGDEQQKEEEKQLNERKQHELKFQIQQKQHLIQQQQAQAEAYNIAHPGQFQNIYQSVGTIHHVLPAEEYDDLMPDPVQYFSLMSGAPPPPPVPVPPPSVPIADPNEPVLPPGIDEEDALESHAPLSSKGPLPKDFQDALSIIFDKGVEKDEQDAPATSAKEDAPAEHRLQATEQVIPNNEIVPDPSQINEHITQSMLQQHSQDIDPTAIPMELDEQSQFLMYGTMTDKPLVFNEIPIPQVTPEEQPLQHQEIVANDFELNEKILTQSIPTPPIQILDGDGNLKQIPGQVIEVPSVDADGNPVMQADDMDIAEDEERKQKRSLELDDLAMLGIDAEDLAAQCI